MAQLPSGEPAPANGILPVAPGHAFNSTFHAYVHVPFCRVRCGYCDFNTYTPAELQISTGLTQISNSYIDLLIKEIDLAKTQVGNATVPTIFFGGGTPSLMEPTDIGRKLLRLRSRQQHAVVQRVQESPLADPAPALDELGVHHRDLPGGPGAHPVDMVRAITLVWLFSGQRSSCARRGAAAGGWACSQACSASASSRVTRVVLVMGWAQRANLEVACAHRAGAGALVVNDGRGDAIAKVAAYRTAKLGHCAHVALLCSAGSVAWCLVLDVGALHWFGSRS